MSSLQPHRIAFTRIADPAPSPLARFLSRTSSTLATWLRRVRTRRHLREVPAERYADLGLTPRAVAVELAKGFWQA